MYKIKTNNLFLINLEYNYNELNYITYDLIHKKIGHH